MSDPYWPRQQLLSHEFVNCAGSILFSPPTVDPPKPLQVCFLHCLIDDLWVLPKGRQDIGESLSQAAIRETYEETGYQCELLPIDMFTRAPPPGASMADRPYLSRGCTEPFLVSYRNMSSTKNDTKFVWWFISRIIPNTQKQSDTQMPDENYDSVLWPVDIDVSDESALDAAVSRLTYNPDQEVVKVAINLVHQTYPHWFTGNSVQTLEAAANLAREHSLTPRAQLAESMGKLKKYDLTDSVKLEESIEGKNDLDDSRHCYILGKGDKKVPLILRRIDFPLTTNRRTAKLFKAEMRTCIRAQHHNVLRVRGFTIEESRDSGIFTPFIVLDMPSLYLTLQYLIESNIEYNIFKLACDIANGLKYLHDNDVVHSNLKSGNILIKEGSAIITGFAFTNKTLYDNRTLSGSTAQALLPYARWMAIELLNSASEHKRLDFTSESDIWSLGMTFYELIAKKRPYFHIEGNQDAMDAIITGELPLKVNNHEDSTPSLKSLWNICEICWKHEPEERPVASGLVPWLNSLSCL